MSESGLSHLTSAPAVNMTGLPTPPFLREGVQERLVA